ncbi:hypothetical protein [Lentibacillus sp. Marseille-P4043]|uniref:hypothetical protein n=1 Tax=Lentibacillus sp. Marseille-P4043 TaxID=2040293 RepID=UPI000D0BAA46|nr:hypothetical protein [Lentibacillus sp. Marseille-P4043]
MKTLVVRAPIRFQRIGVRNIGARSETSAREAKHRREKQNIGARSKTSAREAKHRREKQNIGARSKTSTTKTTTRARKASLNLNSVQVIILQVDVS